VNGRIRNAAVFRGAAAKDAARGQILPLCRIPACLPKAGLNGIPASNKRRLLFPQTVWTNMSGLYILLPVTSPEISSTKGSAASKEDNGTPRMQPYYAWRSSMIDNTASLYGTICKTEGWLKI